jgi:hypothetical protein
MTHTRISRTLAATGVTAALLCALPAVGHTDATGSCDRVRNGQNFIDWARARSNQNHLVLPDRQTRPQSLDSLLRAARWPPHGSGSR